MFVILAKECDKELPKETTFIYQNLSKTYGWEVLAAAVEFVYTRRRGRDPFPTPFELEDVCRKLSGEEFDSPEEISARIVSAITKFGSPNMEGAKKYIGPIGWKMVEMSGGWSSICMNMRVDQTTTYVAQWKSLAARLIEKEEVRKRIAGTLQSARSLAPRSDSCLDDPSKNEPSPEKT